MQRTTRWILAAVMVASMSVLASPGQAQGPSGFRSPEGVPDRVPGSWIVTLAPGARPERDARPLAAEHGGRAVHIYGDAVRGFSFRGDDEQAERLAADPRVQTVEPDLVVRIAGHADRSFEPFQRVVRAHLAVHDGHEGQGARVAVLDTGVADHPAIPRIDRASGRSCRGGGTGDPNGHGTASAGNAVAIAGQATIVPIKVLSSAGTGTVSALICGINHVTRLNGRNHPSLHVHVANMSLTIAASCSRATVFCNALTRSSLSGAMYTAAVGNASRNAGGILPAAHPHVIGVSALAGSSRLASFSNFGAVAAMIAPGVNIRSPVPGGWQLRSGTSRSAPMVAGVAAIVRSLQPEWSAAQTRRTVLSTGRCPDGQPVHTNFRCGGRWGGDPDGITEPAANAVRAGRVAALVPSVVIQQPRPDGVVIDGRQRIVVLGRDAALDANRNIVDATRDLRVRARLVGQVNTDWTRLEFRGSGRFVERLDTTEVPNGSYRLVVRARDGDGNGARTAIGVVVRN